MNKKRENAVDLICATIMAKRDIFKTEYNKIQEETKKKEQSARADFRGDRLAAELQKVEEEKNKALEELKKESKTAVVDRSLILRQLEMDEVTRETVAYTDVSALRLLLNDMTITQTEFSALCSRFGGHGYWTRKVLQTVAEKNGLVYDNPCVDDRLSMLAELTRNTLRFFDLYVGDGKNNISDEKVVRALASVSDEVLSRFARQYMQGVAVEDDARVIAASLENVLSAGDNFTAGARLANILKNAPENVKNGLILKLAQKKAFEADSTMFDLAGLDMETIRKDLINRLENYSASEKRVGEILEADNIAEAITEAVQNDPYGYTSGLIKSKCRHNEELKEAATDAGLIEPEEGEA